VRGLPEFVEDGAGRRPEVAEHAAGFLPAACVEAGRTYGTTRERAITLAHRLPVLAAYRRKQLAARRVSLQRVRPPDGSYEYVVREPGASGIDGMEAWLVVPRAMLGGLDELAGMGY